MSLWEAKQELGSSPLGDAPGAKPHHFQYGFTLYVNATMDIWGLTSPDLRRGGRI